uniref:Uncharacterized protein n=2 Tax=Brassica TaxID=3705 RepID=A0A3P5ZUD9_BRACM|nr:unnamed protein product [Brassica rapa]VDD41117.1 unnamed protein product [Brassica oleracea]
MQFFPFPLLISLISLLGKNKQLCCPLYRPFPCLNRV